VKGGGGGCGDRGERRGEERRDKERVGETDVDESKKKQEMGERRPQDVCFETAMQPFDPS
jgi:hypothetical protein